MFARASFVVVCLLYWTLPGETAVDHWRCLFYSSGSSINFVNLNHSKPSSPSKWVNQKHGLVATSKFGEISQFDFIWEDATFYWVDLLEEKIKKMQFSSKFSCEDRLEDGSSNVTELFSVSLMPYDGFACDWLSRNLYWIDSEEGRIEVGSVNGQFRKTIVWNDLDQPRVLSLDPIGRYMYWVDVGMEPRIERCGLDGSHRSILVKRPIIGIPCSLAVDLLGQNVYWFDQEMLGIYYSDLSGNNIISQLPFSNSSLNPSFFYSFSMIVGMNSIYYVDSKKLFLKAGNKLNLSSYHNVWRFSEVPKEIKLLENQAAFKDDQKSLWKNLCRSSGCSHLCLPSPLTPYFTCACPSGVVLLSDNKTCNDGPSQMLLLARQTDIRRISLDTPDFTDTLIINESEGMMVAIDYDPVEEKVYWTDVDLHLIKRSDINGRDIEVVLDEGIHTPEGITIDWLSRRLYWTDTGTDLIETSDMSGSMRKTIVGQGLDEPRAIVVDPFQCVLFWSDWGNNKRIERSSLDGSDRRAIVDWSISWPNGLALDRPVKRLYWADARFDSIESCDYNGADRKRIVHGDLPHVFGLALIGDHIYWTEWQRRVIERADKNTGMSRLLVIEELPNLMGIAATHSKVITHALAELNISNGCSINNGDCSHFCFRITNEDRKCSCPDDLLLSEIDRRSCHSPPAYIVFSDGGDIKLQPLSETSWSDEIEEEERELTSFEENEEGSHVVNDKFLTADDNESDDEDSYGRYFIVKRFNSMPDAEKEGGSVQRTQRKLIFDYIVSDGVLLLYDPAIKVMSEFHLDSLNGSGSNESGDDARKDLITIKPHAFNQGVKFQTSFTVDWLSGNIYWTDWDKIEISRRNGSNRLAIVWQNCRPRAISVDPVGRFLFWSNEMNSFGVIERASLDGSFRAVIIRNVGQVSGMALDTERLQLFWADQKLGHIEYSSYDGSDRVILLSNVEPYRMALLGDILYWSNSNGQIIATNRMKGGQKVIANGLLGQADVKVIHPSLQKGYGFCSLTKNGGCSDLCINLDNTKKVGSKRITHRCACPTQLLLSGEDNSTCRASNVAAYMATSNGITSLSLEEISGSPDVLLPIQPLHPLRSIDFHPFHDALYFVEGSGKISSMRPDGTQLRVLVDTAKEGSPVARMVPFDIVINDHLNVLYWSDLTYGTIVRTRIDEPMDHLVFNLFPDDFLRKPKYLALHGDKQILYWTSGFAIEAAHLKSMTAHEVTLKTIINGSKVGPICVDPSTNTLFWFNVDVHSIETSKLNGDGRSVLVEGVRSCTGIGVSGSHLYWIDKEKQTLESCLKGNGRSRVIVRSRLPAGLKDLVILNRKKVMKTKSKKKDDFQSLPTEVADCPANHFSCLIVKYDYSLHQGQDGSMKNSDHVGVLYEDEFGSNLKDVGCVPISWKCDGNVDCLDAYDEANCTSCKEDSILCLRDRKCLEKSLVCNGKEDCSDGIDETDCISCLSEISPLVRKHVVCHPGLCHSIMHICDGYLDCENGADEEGCTHMGALEGKRGFNFWLTVISVMTCATLTVAVLIFVLKQKSQCSCSSLRRGKEGLVTLTTTEPLSRNHGISSSALAPVHASLHQRHLLSNSVSTIEVPQDNIQGPYPSLATSFVDSGLTGSDKSLHENDGLKKSIQKQRLNSFRESKTFNDWRCCHEEVYFPCEDVPALPPPPPTPCSRSNLIRSRQTSSAGSSNGGHITPMDSPHCKSQPYLQTRPPRPECLGPRLALPPSGRSSNVSKQPCNSENSSGRECYHFSIASGNLKS